jgi:hypothetical protein
MQTQRGVLRRLERRVQELHDVLQMLDERAMQSIAELKAVDFEPEHHVEIFAFNPPILRISCSPDSAWKTDPAERNKRALKNA